MYLHVVIQPRQPYTCRKSLKQSIRPIFSICICICICALRTPYGRSYSRYLTIARETIINNDNNGDLPRQISNDGGEIEHDLPCAYLAIMSFGGCCRRLLGRVHYMPLVGSIYASACPVVSVVTILLFTGDIQYSTCGRS